MEAMRPGQSQVDTKVTHNVSAPSSLDWRQKGFVTSVSTTIMKRKCFLTLCRWKIKKLVVRPGHSVQQEHLKVNSTRKRGHLRA